ncbi:MAG: thioredoxin family protein [Pseudolabrys sp.]|nr:thioredoxin family protein [Pseudolabrys sp.]
MEHTIVSQDEWLKARKALLVREKEFTRARDALSAERRKMPWVKVDKPYVFDGPDGRETLADLFGCHSQLIVYHFMLGPGWLQGCPSCSFLADHFDGAIPHLAQRDVAMLAVSRAPFAEIADYKKRMGWQFEWLSSFGNDFNRDFSVSFAKDEIGSETLYNYGTSKAEAEEMPGISVFAKNQAGEVFHTYSTYARGLDIVAGAYNLLDMVPKGRDEASLPWTMAWVKRHDEYDRVAPEMVPSGCCG